MASGETKPHELVDLSPSDPPPQNNPIFPTKAGSSKPTAVHIDRIDVQTPYHASPQQPTLSTEAHQKLRAVLGDHILSNTVSEHLRKDANEARSQTANQEENYYMITFYQEYMCGNKSRLMRDLEEVRVATHGESDIEIIMTSKSGDIYRTYRSSTRAIDPLYVVPSYNPMVAPFDPSNAKAFIDEIHSFLVNYERACLCLKNVLSGAGTQVLLDDAPDGIPRDVLRTLSNLAEASDKILKDITDLGIAVKVVKERMEQEVLGVLFSHKDGASWQDVDAVKERLKGLAQRVDRMEGRINFELVQRANALIQRVSERENGAFRLRRTVIMGAHAKTIACGDRLRIYSLSMRRSNQDSWLPV
ncbi:hypothetical protein BJ508DRAFT_12824 [Ascobolus immersus RN42]|uniref:Uncharacterized protein n=1 Tax=Ascobolus immersus RN42 TaxID=1160509 RepID=A0A3N4IG04_ASCIM|nr:hypothetical protein BJ508DRAFT_12824 [Ascobolus immersus RN42]